MSKHKVHVLIPYTTEVACGQQGYTANGGVRERITCRLCRETEWFKKLPSMPRKFREAKKK